MDTETPPDNKLPGFLLMLLGTVGIMSLAIQLSHQNQLLSLKPIGNTENNADIDRKVQQFKETNGQQYPYFEFFPYITTSMVVQYDAPYTLNLYLNNSDSESKTAALQKLDEYLNQFGVSVENLKNSKVQLEVKQLTQDNLKKVSE
jgi:hypothetical protein